MKKIILAAMMLVLLLNGCSRSPEVAVMETTSPTTSETETVVPEAEAETTAPVSDSVVPATEETLPAEKAVPQRDDGSSWVPVPEKPQIPEEIEQTIPPPDPQETVPPTEAVIPEATEETHPDISAVETKPIPCEHLWTPIQNISGEYTETPYVMCSCGAKFRNSAEWSAHRDSFLGTEDLLDHTGYSSSSDRTEVTPPMTVWQCSKCGASKTINSWDNP